MFFLRVAGPDDAEQMRGVWLRSIREICGPDYGNDRELLEQWCSTKTVERVRALLADRDIVWLIATEASGKIVGLGGLHRRGDILACYVLPEVLHRGVGKTLLLALERKAVSLGLKELRLGSTATAVPFYKRNGYCADGEPFLFLDVIRAYPMKKALVVHEPGG
jgi:N-acetylglutamate synthase-like GNAT family acetyltransferase